jgi:hypothetical protein
MTLETIETTPDEAPDLPPPPMTDATRYLCVGAYIDPVFRDRCLREVYYQDKRFVAPSYGFDLATVLDACLRARNIDILRDVVIVATLGLAAYLNWISVAAVGAALVCLWVTKPVARVVRDFGKRVITGTAVDKTKSPWRGLALLLAFAATWIIFVALASKAVSAAATTFTGARTMSGGAALLVAPIVFLLPTVFAVRRQSGMEAYRQNRCPPAPRMNARMTEIVRQSHGNTIIYHDFEPFIGAGDVVDTWGFVTRLVQKQPDVMAGQTRKPEKDREFLEPPFSAANIVSYVWRNLSNLVDGRPELSIPAMTVSNRVFQSDQELRRRSVHTDAEELAKIIREPTGPARHYIACQDIAWGGDVVTTVHIQIAVQAKSLYLEVTTTSMAPCNEDYRIVDTENGTGARAWVKAAGRAILDTPLTIVRSPVRLIHVAADTTGRGGWGRVGHSRTRDHGAMVSVRQLGTRDELRNFTQRQDILKFKRLIERQVFDHILDYLDKKGVDTAEYRERATTVLSVTGGVNNWGTAQYHGDVAGGDVNKPAT